MKHLQTYQQLNESNKGSDLFESLLKKLGDKTDTKKLFKLLLPFKKQMGTFVKKYSSNGKIDADRIFNDLKSFNLTTESLEDDDSMYDILKSAASNNIILKFLYKFFVTWPKNFVTALWSIFHETVIESWSDPYMGKGISIMMSLLWVITAVAVYLLSYLAFMFIDMEMNGLDHGKVISKKFQASHEEIVTTTVMVGKVAVISSYPVHIADRWFIQLKGDGDDARVEDWVTYNPSVADHTKNGDDVKKDDNWSWSGTEKR